MAHGSAARVLVHHLSSLLFKLFRLGRLGAWNGATKEENVWLRLVDHVVDPALRLLHAQGAPFLFAHQVRLWNQFDKLFWQYDVPVNQERMGVSLAKSNVSKGKRALTCTQTDRQSICPSSRNPWNPLCGGEVLPEQECDTEVQSQRRCSVARL